MCVRACPLRLAVGTIMKDAYTIDELVELGPLGRTLLYRAMGEQRLRS